MESSYKASEMAHWPEDIVLCVDVDGEMDTELKRGPSPSLTRFDLVKQALVMFVHSKLLISPDHAFAIATIGESASWHMHQYVSDFDTIASSLRSLTSQGSSSSCDLSSLVQLLLPDSKVSKQQNRTFRVILVYCRSDIIPTFSIQSPDDRDLLFDVLYVHDKPSPTNCPQQVYDALVEVLEKFHSHSYILETVGSFSRVLFRHMCQLLAHPQQRCLQDDFMPVDLCKQNPVATAPAAVAALPAPPPGNGAVQNQPDAVSN